MRDMRDISEVIGSYELVCTCACYGKQCHESFIASTKANAVKSAQDSGWTFTQSNKHCKCPECSK